jgi:hypothetical protein
MPTRREDRRGHARRPLPHRRRRASRDADGYITYVGRADDVFKASDYRISPFELESVLIEHPAVAEAAVVPSPDPLRLAVPKAFVMLAAGHAPTPPLAAGHLRLLPAPSWRPTSASAASSSPTCPRPSPARSAASSCASCAMFNQLYRSYFQAPYPARTTITGCLSPALRYEIECIAVAP